MSVGRTPQNYTQIRNDQLSAHGKHKGGDEYLRMGKSLYLHNPDNKWFKGWGSLSGTRYVKRSDAAREIRESINREFAGLTDKTGKPVNVGDMVFQKLNNPKKIRHQDFRKIDAAIADVLVKQSLSESGLATSMDRVMRTAHMFHAASRGQLNRACLKNWARHIVAHEKLSAAIVQDARAAGMSPDDADRFARETLESVREQGADSKGRNMMDTRFGLNLTSLDLVRNAMIEEGVAPVEMLEIRQDIVVQQKTRTSVCQMEQSSNKMQKALFGVMKIAGGNMDAPPAFEPMRQFAANGAVLQRELRAYARAPETFPPGTRTQLSNKLAEHVRNGQQLLAQMKNGNSWEQTHASLVEEHLLAATELCITTAPYHQRYCLEHRPVLTPPNQISQRDPLVDFKHTFEPVKVRHSKQLYKPRKRHDAAMLTANFNAVQHVYNHSMARVATSLKQYQNMPTPENLARLTDAIDKAGSASDHYLRAINMASRRLGRNPKKNGELSARRQRRVSRLNSARDAASAQRVQLQNLGLRASQANDQHRTARWQLMDQQDQQLQESVKQIEGQLSGPPFHNQFQPQLNTPVPSPSVNKPQSSDVDTPVVKLKYHRNDIVRLTTQFKQRAGKQTVPGQIRQEASSFASHLEIVSDGLQGLVDNYDANASNDKQYAKVLADINQAKDQLWEFTQAGGNLQLANRAWNWLGQVAETLQKVRPGSSSVNSGTLDNVGHPNQMQNNSTPGMMQQEGIYIVYRIIDDPEVHSESNMMTTGGMMTPNGDMTTEVDDDDLESMYDQTHGVTPGGFDNMDDNESIAHIPTQSVRGSDGNDDNSGIYDNSQIQNQNIQQVGKEDNPQIQIDRLLQLTEHYLNSVQGRYGGEMAQARLKEAVRLANGNEDLLDPGYLSELTRRAQRAINS